jgi:hypothetical protein
MVPCQDLKTFEIHCFDTIASFDSKQNVLVKQKTIYYGTPNDPLKNSTRLVLFILQIT